jgi:hypothetical protein
MNILIVRKITFMRIINAILRIFVRLASLYFKKTKSIIVNTNKMKTIGIDINRNSNLDSFDY